MLLDEDYNEFVLGVSGSGKLSPPYVDAIELGPNDDLYTKKFTVTIPFFCQ